MPSLYCVLSVQTTVICLQIPALDIFFINKAAAVSRKSLWTQRTAAGSPIPITELAFLVGPGPLIAV
ncbi:hypothetical protein WN943_025661 [Citrus x changshan-huyou]